MSGKTKLEKLRNRIDEIDRDLLQLINDRAQVARDIAEVKGSSPDQDQYYRPEREAQILRNIISSNTGPVSDEEAARLFREIMSVCLALEQQLTIAYLGPEGTFTQTAALKHFGHSVNTMAYGSIDQVFREVEAGTCQYGVVPVENSIEGVVNHTLDMLINSSLEICGEVELRIHHHLLTHALNLDQVRKVFSHQQSLAQCRQWLDEHLLNADRIAVSSNAEAARLVMDQDDAAAIAGVAAAEYYSLPVLQQNIEDHPDNTTRFLVLGRHSTRPSGKDKTSILFSAANRPGALHDLLACFATNNVSMTRIESRPSRAGMWDYVFFVDIEGHAEDKQVVAALKKLRETAAMVKLLGSYPVAVL